jgi:hypothetical protein
MHRYLNAFYYSVVRKFYQLSPLNGCMKTLRCTIHAIKGFWYDFSVSLAAFQKPFQVQIK